MKLRLSTGEEYTLHDGESLYDALKRNEQYIIASCGGKGTCGKCKVRIVDGKADIRSYGKLSEKDKTAGSVLACQTYPQTDMSIEIPNTSKLIVGDKIAIARSRDLLNLLHSMGAKPSSLIKRAHLVIPPPTIDDNISDIERLNRALEDGDIRLTYSPDFASGLAGSLRELQWDVTLCYEPVESKALFIEPSKPDGPRYGMAVDIGTTTIVLNLVDLSDGTIIDVGSTYNSQMRYGDDVITRIVYATESGGLQTLRESVLSDINDLASIMCERHSIRKERIESLAIAGNTTMTQLFWGLTPAYIREEPYIPTANHFPPWSARDAGIDINPLSPVYSAPCIASYVGGDIVAGVLASKMHGNPEISLFMDIGTNGEIVVGNNEWLMTAACSAGPCFEGSGIRCGMRATHGAVESIQFDAAGFVSSLGVIGDVPPLGICGSGMIDAVSGMFLGGIIDQRGKFVKGIKTDGIKPGPEGLEYILYRDGDREIVLTEVDIENILRAKAAIYAGVSLLIKEVGLPLASIERVYIAGGFGNYLDIGKGIILGMLPDLPEEKFTFLGNTSIAGAYLTLMSEDMRKEAADIASKMTYVELSVSGRFMDEYMSALFLPHTDISLFPSVKDLMAK